MNQLYFATSKIERGCQQKSARVDDAQTLGREENIVSNNILKTIDLNFATSTIVFRHK